MRLRLRMMMLILDQFRRDVLDLHDMIDEAGGHGAARHAALGLVIKLGLGDRQAAMFLDGGQAQRAVAPGP